MCFLIKRKKTYHLQAKVPNKLAEVLGRGDLSLTLYTQELSRASRMREHLGGRFETAFRKIKSRRWVVDMVIKTGELTRANIRKLLRDFVKAGLDDFEREQATGRPGIHGKYDGVASLEKALYSLADRMDIPKEEVDAQVVKLGAVSFSMIFHRKGTLSRYSFRIMGLSHGLRSSGSILLRTKLKNDESWEKRIRLV